MTAVCSTTKVDLVRSLGADRVVDYTQEDFTRLGQRHDLILDIAGSRSFRECRRVLTPEATVVVDRREDSHQRGPRSPPPHRRNASGVAIGRSQKVKFFIAKIEKEDLAFLARPARAGTVKSRDRPALRAERGRGRSRYLGEGHARGKVIISRVTVDADRLRDLTLELVEVESPTGDTAEVARLYGRRLEELGMEVELLDERFPATPIVIGRLRGGEPGPTVVLNGHLDTVPIPHEPPRVDGRTIYGRGTADMKGALACAAEAARAVAGSGRSRASS